MFEQLMGEDSAAGDHKYTISSFPYARLYPFLSHFAHDP